MFEIEKYLHMQQHKGKKQVNLPCQIFPCKKFNTYSWEQLLSEFYYAKILNDNK